MLQEHPGQVVLAEVHNLLGAGSFHKLRLARARVFVGGQVEIVGIESASLDSPGQSWTVNLPLVKESNPRALSS